jgi:hypothetical protein
LLFVVVGFSLQKARINKKRNKRNHMLWCGPKAHQLKFVNHAFAMAPRCGTSIKSIPNTKEIKFQAIFFVHLFFCPPPSNCRTMQSFFHPDLYITCADTS